jgi:PAS domain S-box-containing protein
MKDETKKITSIRLKTPDAFNEFTPDISDILDALPFYVLLVDEDHHILTANRAVRTHLGVEPEEIKGRYCPKVIHGLDRPYEGCPLEEAAASGQAIERELLDNKDGRWLCSAIYPIQGVTSEGKRIFFHMVTDITERKRAEEQLAASHEQLLSLSKHLESLREEERKKIARDLHDETSQVVTSLTAHLEAAANMLPADAPKVRAILKNAEDLSVSILDQLQKLIYELHPLVLDDLGLVAAVRWLLENNLKAAGIKVDFKTAGRTRRLPRHLETAIFRVAQEAVSNIARHAKARNAVVRLEFSKNAVSMHIRDDGRGFDVGEAMNLKQGLRGYGLLGMKERTQLIGGTFALRTGPGNGTEIDIRFPLQHETSRT